MSAECGRLSTGPGPLCACAFKPACALGITNQKGDHMIDTELLALGKEDLVDLVMSLRGEVEDLTARLDAIVALERS